MVIVECESCGYAEAELEVEFVDVTPHVIFLVCVGCAPIEDDESCIVRRPVVNVPA
jgi:hypothetical protein